MAGGVGCRHGADYRVVDRAVADGRAGAVSMLMARPGVSRLPPDINGCMFMSWLVTVAPGAMSMRRVSTRPPDLPLDQLTLVLSRSPQQEAAFQQFLAEQQNPASPTYHHWLTPPRSGSE